MSDPIAFTAILNRVVVDKEGESKVTFTIPQRDLDKILILAKETEKVLAIGVAIYLEVGGAGQEAKIKDDLLQEYDL